MKWNFPLAAALASLSFTAHGANADRPELDAQLVSFYTEEALVTEATAKERLSLLAVARDLQAEISGEDWFAGMYVEHTPRFQIHVLRAASPGDITSRLESFSSVLAPHLVVRDVVYSWAELERQAGEVLRVLRTSGIQADLEIDIQANAIKLRAPDLTALNKGIQAAAPGFAANLILEEAPLIEPLAPIYGGVSLANCTSGFGLVSPGGSRVISTAGHCYPDPQFYQSLQLPWLGHQLQGSWDIGWLSPRTFTPTNQIWNGTNYWSITSIRAAASQLIGDPACKCGHVTDVQCGFIRSKTEAPAFIPGVNADFISVGSSTMAGAPGDSGGPVWSSSVALGVISGGHTVSGEYRVVYMAADRVFPATGHYILVTP